MALSAQRLVVWVMVSEMLLLSWSWSPPPPALGSRRCKAWPGCRGSPCLVAGGAATATTATTETTHFLPLGEKTEGQAVEVRQLDLRLCSPEDVDLMARTFAEGFFTRGEDGTQPSPKVIAEIAADKALSIHTRFRGQPAAGAEVLPAGVVMCLEKGGGILGFASVFGAVRVKDAAGSRLLTGREAENFLSALSQAPAEQRMQTTTRRAALLCDVTVLPEARRRGVGQLLCDEAARVASTWGYSDLLLLVNDDNLPAKAMYEKLGFKDGGTRCNSLEERVEGGQRVQCSVSNLLLSKSTRSKASGRGSSPAGGVASTAAAQHKPLKLFAQTRDEEIRRKQLVGHLIPAVAVLAFYAAVSTSPVGAFWAPIL